MVLRLSFVLLRSATQGRLQSLFRRTQATAYRQTAVPALRWKVLFAEKKSEEKSEDKSTKQEPFDLVDWLKKQMGWVETKPEPDQREPSEPDQPRPNTPMTPAEALQVLQVEKGATADEIEERFQKLMKINDPTRGGSFYLQCKVLGAKFVLFEELGVPMEKKTEEQGEEKKTEQKEQKK